MGQYLTFKLNISPEILLDYIGKDREHFINNIIPSVLAHAVALEKVGNRSDIYKIEMDFTNGQADFDASFKNLKVNTEKLLDKYQEIYVRYKKNSEIFYSNVFLNLKDKCSRQRLTLEKKYPVVIKAYDFYTDEEIDQYIGKNLESKIGTGITHLRKFYKIERYINEVGIQPDNLFDFAVYYRPEKEEILIETDSEQEALLYANYFEDLVNNNKVTVAQIGKINVNPIYELIQLNDEKYTEISFVIVYPNGNPPLDRHNILMDSEAKEIQCTILGADERPIKKESVEDYLNREAQNGYLKKLSAKGKGIFRKIKKTSLS